MVVCPAGHASAADDFCDVCGLLIGPVSQAQPAPDPWGQGPGTPGAPPAARPAPGGPPGQGWPAQGGPGQGGPGPGAGRQGPGYGAPGQGGDSTRPAGNACPNCATPRVGSFKFCDVCGFNFGTGLMPDGRPPGGVPSGGAPHQGGDAPSGSPGPAAPSRREPTMFSQPAYGGSAPTATPPDVAGTFAGSGPAIRSVSSAPSPGPSASGPPSAWSAGSGTWTAVVSADRAYYDHVREENGPDAEGITFPAYCAERRFMLAGPEMRIGRHSASRGIYPEIDLTGPPTDPGISRLHAVLIARPSGEWAVLDPGSANGTMVNGTEIPVGEEIPLRDGDRINVGAWTAITVQRG